MRPTVSLSVALLLAACDAATSLDAATVPDAGSSPDAGSARDAEVSRDAEASDAWPTPRSDAGTRDAGPPSALSTIVTGELFEQLFLHRGSAPCRGAFYTYESFLAAATSFPGFGAVGDDATRRREVAAFLAQIGHETTGGWPTAPDGPYAWGLCWITEGATVDAALLPDYCAPSAEHPCTPGRKYFGRGPMQLSWNYNYGPCGAALGEDLLADPDRVASDPALAFRTALWFWMTPQAPKPSCHDVMTGGFAPSAADLEAGRVPGFGLTTNIINGGLECGRGPDDRVADRIGYFERFTALLGTDPGESTSCDAMTPYGG